MALRGNLRDFSLPDVFQLVTFSRKTGVLRIVREDAAQGTVWFRDGEVFFASSNWHTELIGERLVRAQRITPQALVRALEAKALEPADGRRLGQILIDEGYITEAVLETFVTEQIEDTIFDLMRWDEGEFDFEAMPEVVEEDIGLSVSIENIVMEGSRRLEEWGRIKKKIPSMDVVFKMATAPGEGTFEISLKPVEWQLLLLTDGSRSVAELALAAKRTDFEVARIIYGLLSAGLLEFATDEEIARSRAERAEREARLAAVEAQRRAAEQAQAQAALDRESQLVQQAEMRRSVVAGAPPAAPIAPVAPVAPAAAAAFVAPAGSVPAEEPQFLGQPAAIPTADDAAVLEQFMGAVLDQRAVPPPAHVPPSTPHVAAEEPAFMSVEHTDIGDMPLIPVSSIEEILPDLGVQAPSGPAMDAVAAAFEPAAPPAAVEPMGVAQVPEAAPDFERDLMALGLGELPPELAGTPPGPGGAPVQPAAAGSAVAHAPGTAPDFSELLESLDADAAHAQAGPDASGFDAELLADDGDVVAGGVISTDAFLGDVGMGEFELSGGLTDELSALTGVERKQPARPQASVHAIPEEGGVLQRDARVDKDTVLRIIEGIKNL